MKKITKSNLWPVLLTGLFIWIKTYLICRFTFDIEIENVMQEFIYFISPLSTILLFLSLTLFASGKRRRRLLIFVDVVFTIILIGNLLFYGFFDDFITLPVLLQTKNVADLGSSITSLIDFKVILAVFDLGFLFFYFKKKKNPLNFEPFKLREISTFALSVVILFIFNLGLAEIQRPQLLTRSFDRKILVKNIGLYNYHMYDIALSTKTSAQKAMADSSELVDIENYVAANTKAPNKEMFGAAKGKNVILISLESLQNFVINNTVNGEEVTPFLNDLIDESYYFDNFYHQTGQGKTSDSEFIVENSLYPVDRGAVFFTHPNNKYLATPNILKENGYYSSVFHANDKSFWNRDLIYNSFGYDKFYDVASFDVTDENSVGWGLKDKEFFEQSVKYLEEMPKPFLAKYITLTNHYPYELDDADKLISPFDSGDITVDNYFTTVRYMDEALKNFFKDLKESGIYDDSIIVMYGDHYGVSENHNPAMEKYLDKPITPYESVQLQKVPFIVHFPNQEKGETISTIGGQIDIRPTLLHLLGIETKGNIEFGQDLFAKDRNQFTVLRDGSFISDEYVYRGGTLFDRLTGEKIEDKTLADPYVEKAKQELDYSDRIIYGDLLRFYEKK